MKSAHVGKQKLGNPMYTIYLRHVFKLKIPKTWFFTKGFTKCWINKRFTNKSLYGKEKQNPLKRNEETEAVNQICAQKGRTLYTLYTDWFSDISLNFPALHILVLKNVGPLIRPSPAVPLTNLCHDLYNKSQKLELDSFSFSS